MPDSPTSSASIPQRAARRPFVLVTGLSGAGRVTALHALEDLGYVAVDNVPLPLLGDLMRSTLENAGKHEVSLREELQFIGPYLEIEQARLGPRLSVLYGDNGQGKTNVIEAAYYLAVLRSFGVFATILGMLTVPFWASKIKDPMGALNGGYWTITVLSIIGLGVTTYSMLDDVWYWFFACGLVGIATGIAFVYITQYYTAGGWRPVQEIARASRTGSATNMPSSQTAATSPAK